MHCPRCGQEQVSDETRFCTKCGLEMSDVKVLLTPELAEKKTKSKFENSTAARQGLGLILFGFVLMLIFLILREMNVLPGAYSKIAFLFFLVAGIVRIFIPFIFGEKTSQKKSEAATLDNPTTQSLSSASFDKKSLPEADYRPPLNFGEKDYDTNDLAVLPSVTEETTRKLEKKLQRK